MSERSQIEWTDATWNPIRGCTKISPGCTHCYAATFAERFRGVPGHPYEQGFDLRLVPDKLRDPLLWTTRKRVFVNSMSDLFHEEVPEEYIVRIAEVMAAANWHTYQVLTKRPERMAELLRTTLRFAADLPHVWWGVSVENRRHGLPRIDHLRGAPAAVRFLSVEPLLEDLGQVNLTDIHWMIVGGESGAGARPMAPEWVRSLRDQCRASKVAFFFKQWGGTRKSETGRKLDNRTHNDQPAVGNAEMPPRRVRLELVGESQLNQRANPPPRPQMSVDDDTLNNGNDKNQHGRASGLMLLKQPVTPNRPMVKPVSQADSNPEYWGEYSNLQRVKHELIREYLKGWFPKLTLGPTGCRRLLYIDTHAGRGKHQTGELGSPLVALTTLLEHTARSQMLQNTEVHFYFIEGDEENATALRTELAGHTLPTNVFAEVESGDCFQIIEKAVADMEKDGKRMAPAFIFVDPYGFKLPGKLLRKLLSYPKVELFVNVIWRELDMAIQQCRGGACAPQPADTVARLFEVETDPERERAVAQRRADARASLEVTLNSVFDGDGWRTIDADGADRRAEQCADLFRRMTGAPWGTYLRMLDNERVRYFLLHLTKHAAGRDLMKDCMWKACPQGGFYASKSDSPSQVLLIEPEPDFRPLHKWVVGQLSAGPKRWQILTDGIREELWLGKHLNEVLRSMKTSNEIEAEGKFAQTQNPLLRLRGK